MQLKIYILKQVKKFTAFVYMLQEMKAITKSHWGLGVTYYPELCESKTKS